MPAPRPSLAERLPGGPHPGAGASPAAEPLARDAILDRFLGWIAECELEPYPEQETALLELMLGKHVILGTPTGSGKTLVAQGLHFESLCRGERSFYAAPTKALVSEKFFAFCRDFGPERVGMLTGDASINRDAPVICCTTEVLAQMALREGAAADVSSAVLDEFHYYGDRDRGRAWQLPLIALPHTRFLLMSATLGNTAVIESRLAARSGREVVAIHSDRRPVPLDFEYRETSLHETLEELVASGRAPVYVVHFTQRECADLAQGLTSAKFCSREEKRRIDDALGSTRFDSAYGKTLRRILRFGVGVHHAGLLPRYRLLVEQLAQRGLLKVICGTDTLGVGVNIPIRTVVFARLSKFDGEKVSILSVREFKQIAGRAGRRGFDERGAVVCQAPEHVTRSRGQKKARRKPAPRGFVPWNQQTFERLVERLPEMLPSRFDVDHGMLISVLERVPRSEPSGEGYRALIELIGTCHEGEGRKARLRRRAALLLRSLRRAGIVEAVRGVPGGGSGLRVAEALQRDFSLHETLSLFLVEAVEELPPEEPEHPLRVLTRVESILEDPKPILREQARRARDELFARLKAEGVPFEERLRQVEQVSHPRPDRDEVEQSFRAFALRHPWVGAEDVRPKSVAREMFEHCRGFSDTVREYQIARSEGLLLRYLSQVHNALVKSVPERARSEGVLEVIGYLRALLERIDSSLLEAWEGLREPGGQAPVAADEPSPPRLDPAQRERRLLARARAELHQLVRALAAGDYEEAAGFARPDPDDPWDAERLRRELAPFFESYERILFTPEARRADRTLLKRREPGCWDVYQVLLDPAGDHLWALEGEVDLRDAGAALEGPLVRVRRIGT